MIQRLIGDVPVGAIGLGGASLTFDGLDPDRIDAVVNAALDAGVTYFDSAAAYTLAGEDAHNERLLGRVLRGHDVVIGTKGGHYRDGESFPLDGSRARIRSQVDLSLAALGRDAIDLYFLHWPDPAIPINESVGFIDELRIEGKVRQIGVSNVTAEQLTLAQSVAAIAAVQNPFSSSDPLLSRTDVAYLAYSPLGGTGAPLAQRVTGIAGALGLSPQRLVLAWQLTLGSTVIPIAGATRVATVEDSAAASDLVLDSETIAAIERELL